MVEGSMTQGAGQGPDVWHGGETTHGEGTARALSAVPRPDGPGGPRDPRSAGAALPARTDPRAPTAPAAPRAAAGGQAADARAAGVPAADGAAPAGPVPDGAAPGGQVPEGPVPSAPAAPATAGTGAAAAGTGAATAGTTTDGRDGMPEEYTPTERDLPVLGTAVAAAGGPEPTMVDMPVPAGAINDGDGPLYVVGDVHGYLDELRTALRQFGIIDADGHWIAGNARLWFLGDFTDRGPDGIGVIELVMQLSAEAAAVGGYCKALMGNHELLLLGAKRFGDTPVNSGAGTASFQAAWLLNGGQRSDMERLADHHLQWMSRLDAIALADSHLLVHSDASCYLDYGDTIEAVNDAITEALQRNDAEETWELFRKFTKRFAFREETAGPAAVRELLDTFGGTRIVHGHSPIPYLLGEVDSEDGESAPDVTGPHVYADGLAVAMDGGVTMAGKLLIAQLPLVQ
ncbi:metallophosphoesterase family protein [Streptomyces sp. NPDC006925]|uniref:metallophosphoesterase family protein n=1 Tax=Streptomyces sp. NPDC006925 TaxID=3364768 RepID=UPI0036B02B83